MFAGSRQPILVHGQFMCSKNIMDNDNNNGSSGSRNVHISTMLSGRNFRGSVPTYPFLLIFFLLIFSFENGPAPFLGWRS